MVYNKTGLRGHSLQANSDMDSQCRLRQENKSSPNPLIQPKVGSQKNPQSTGNCIRGKNQVKNAEKGCKMLVQRTI